MNPISSLNSKVDNSGKLTSIKKLTAAEDISNKVERTVSQLLLVLDCMPKDLMKIIACYAAEPLTAIRKWEDVIPFAGRIVAYQAKTYYYTNGKEGYPWDPFPGLLYGRISEAPRFWSRGEGYSMSYLLLPKDMASNCAFTNDLLEEDANVRMRLADHQELGLIGRVIDSAQAVFAYEFDKETACKWIAHSYKLLQAGM